MDSTPRKHTVLIVDDEAAGILILAQTLKREHNVVTAANGHEALERARDPLNTPDLILLDVQMPGMDGFAVCKTLMADARFRDIPILFLTSLDDVVSKTQAFAAGAVDYITKPFHLPEVQARVRTHLSLKKTREELQKREIALQRLAVTDDLTGLYNTRYLYQALFNALKDCCDKGAPLSCVFMDLDNFKLVVDTHGHLYGSLAIQEVAGAIQEFVKEPAFAVSYAGDEFVFVLPNMDKPAAEELVRKLQDHMAATAFLSHRGLSLALSASFGVASYPEDGQEPRALLAIADDALFKVKESRGVGRGSSAPRS
jgi:diguanylate cyclase (GGDEF)-like protein